VETQENLAAQAATPEASVPLMEEPQRIPREAIVVSAICLGLAALLRLIAISRREIFGDEFWTLAFVTAERGNFLDNFFHGRLPLYYELFRVWGGIVGTGSELLVRLPSVAFGLLTYIAFAMYAHRYLRRAAFAIALVAFAMNPILVASSIHATPFALLGLIAVLSSSQCIRALDEGGTRNWVLYAAVSVLGALTHPFFWFLLMAQFLFAVARPRQTPRPFLLVSATGIVVGVVLMVLSVIYAERTYPKLVDVSTPSPADLARSLVAVLLGDFPRFGYGDKTFIQALLYLFVIVTLGLSVLYYRRREAEAMALPEGVVWIDDTQDVVGKWNRLSLLSFLMYQWVTFLVPAFGIWMVSTYATNMRMDPEYLVLTLPALVILVAAGVDAAWGRAGSLILGIVFVLIMGAYTLEALADRGYGVEHASAKLRSEAFDPAGDALVLVNTTGLEAPLERYMKGYPSTQLRGREPIAETRAAVEKAAVGKERVFVFYHKDYRKFGKAPRSPVREWFDEQMRAQHFNTKVSKWTLSAAEKTELRIYSRLKPGEKNTEAAVGAVPVAPPPPADETTATQ
jgi:hypothetical protein